MKNFVKAGLLAIVLAASAYATAEPAKCSAPSAQRQRELIDYVAKQYHLQQAQVTVADGGQANDACFWKLRFDAASPQKREIVLYLSSDGNYLTPTLYDVRVDPLAEQRRAAVQTAESLVSGSPHSLGPKDAPVTIVEFSDFQCPFCRRFTDVWEHQLTPEERQKVRIVFREYPLTIHPWARPAAELAECVALQNPDAFWKVHDYLFNNQPALKADTLQTDLTTFAIDNAGIDKAQLQTCVDKRLSAGPVEIDMDLAARNNVHATPTFFVNGIRYDGAKDLTQLREIIATALQESQNKAESQHQPVVVPPSGN